MINIITAAEKQKEKYDNYSKYDDDNNHKQQQQGRAKDRNAFNHYTAWKRHENVWPNAMILVQL